MSSPACPSCGARPSPTARFCERCGAGLGEGTAPGGGAAPSPEEEARLEEELDRALAPQYQLVRRIGRGGMGSVFLARDPTLKRTVAVKVLSPEVASDSESRERFRREAQAVAALSHPHVVPIYSVGDLEDGTPYFVMEHVEGGSLADRIAEDGPLGVDEAKRVLGEVASALEAAHGKGIVHRDVKPANILYDPDTGRALVSDFGIAAVRPGSDFAGPTRLTRTGTVIGTPDYMSPEQLLGEAVTEKTDVYGLGLLAYELLTGRSPYEAASPQMMFAAHLKEEPRDLGTLREEADPELRQIARACLAKDPAERPTAAELVRRLRPETGPLLEWPPPGLESLQGKLLGTSLVLVAGSLAFVLPVAVAVSLGAEAALGFASFAQLVLFSLGVVGALLVGGALVRLFLQLRVAARGVRAGYAWGTVAEVLADFRRDTGAVVSGSREYASLGPAERGRLRRARLARAGALLGAGILPPLSLVAYVWMAGRGVELGGSLWLPALGPAGVLLAVAVLSTWRESRTVREARRAIRRRSGRAGELAGLVPAWQEEFEEVREGQPGAGPRWRAGVGLGGGMAVAGALLFGAYLLLPVVLVSVMGGTLVQNTVPVTEEMDRRLLLAERLRPYRLSADQAISLEEAGGAWLRLMSVGGWEPIEPYERVPADPIPEPWLTPSCEEAFGHLTGIARRRAELFEKAAAGPAGFDEAELACFRELEAHPGFEAFARVARAPAVDLTGARYELPFPEDFTALEVPIPRFGQLRSGAYAAGGVAALRLAEGDLEGAERILEEVVSVGFLMVDHGITLIAPLIGVVMVGIAEANLLHLYDAAGRSEVARGLRATRDSVEAAMDEGETPEGLARDAWGPGALRAHTLDVAGDPDRLRGLRWEMHTILGWLPCTNARELLFGPGPELREAWERPGDDLVRYPAEEALLEVMKESPERMARSGETGLAASLLRLPGRILGNPRMEGCVVLLDFLRQEEAFGS